MHERHDLDLIAGYADGSLTSDIEEARRLVTSCAACAEEYRVQREIGELLRAAPAPMLRDEERLRLREGALAAVAPVDGPAPSTGSAPTRWMRRWVALGSVAAALLVMVGIAGSIGNLTGGADEAADGGSVLEASEAPPATSQATADDSARQELAVPGQDAGDAAIAGIVPEETSSPLVDLGPVSDAAVAETVERTIAGIEDRLASDVPVASLALTPTWFNDRERPVPDCFGDVDGTVVAVVTAEVDGSSVNAFVVVDPSGSVAAEAYDTDACTPRPVG